jgi:hypothetical protein
MAIDSAIDRWILSTVERTHQATALKRLYDLQAEFLFNQYEPVNASPEESAIPFSTRLDNWLSCFDSDEDQWTAFHALRYFFFIGQHETEEMYRCAVQNKLLPWLADLAKLDIFEASFETALQAELQAVWTCPATDSLRINGLLHRTGLKGQSLRPDWLSLIDLGSEEKIVKYVRNEEIKYLALFEDFVGSGRQSGKAVEYALSVFNGPVLLAPLVVCSTGHEVLGKLEQKYPGRFTYRPVVVIGANCLVGQTPSPDEPPSFGGLREIMQRGYKKIGKSIYGKAFGFSSVGSLIASYSNCPNNTPPIFHARTDSWPHPIFPRERRS